MGIINIKADNKTTIKRLGDSAHIPYQIGASALNPLQIRRVPTAKPPNPVHLRLTG
jgi:hypothetical protein